jgi:hypothetical protein
MIVIETPAGDERNFLTMLNGWNEFRLRFGQVERCWWVELSQQFWVAGFGSVCMTEIEMVRRFWWGEVGQMRCQQLAFIRRGRARPCDSGRSHPSRGDKKVPALIGHLGAPARL